MNYEFYSIKDKKKISARVVGKVNESTDKRKRFILKGITESGVKLTTMVSEKVFNETIIEG